MNTSNRIKIIRLHEVFNITKKSKSWVYYAMRNGLFPTSFKISARSIGWLESDIYEFTQALAQEKTEDEIRVLVKHLELKRLGGIL
jgi:prophage regulatory protein